jgi:hypothetical protein
MEHQNYYIDNELRVEQSADGLKQATLSKKFIGTSGIAKSQAEAIDEFKVKTEDLLDEFDQETSTQEEDIDKQIKHLEFFLNVKFKKHEWGHNREFDMLRLKYISILDSLMKEKRSLKKDKILKRLSFEEKLLDAKKELSPFKELI